MSASAPDSFDAALDTLCTSIRSLCVAAVEKGGGEAVVRAVGMDTPGEISAFIDQQAVSEMPSRLQQLARRLDKTLLVDIRMLRQVYIGGESAAAALKAAPGSRRRSAGSTLLNAVDLSPGVKAAYHVRELQVQALLTMQLGCMCLLPGLSSLRVGKERDPLPKGIIKRVGKFLGDLQLKQTFSVAGGAVASGGQQQQQQQPSSSSSSSPPEKGVASITLNEDLSFESLALDTLIGLYGSDFPKTLLILYRLLDCQVPPSLQLALLPSSSSQDMQQGGIFLYRPRKTRDVAFRPRYRPEEYPQFESVTVKKKEESTASSSSSSSGGGGGGKDDAKTQPTTTTTGQQKQPIINKRMSSHYLNRSMSGLRKVVQKPALAAVKKPSSTTTAMTTAVARKTAPPPLGSRVTDRRRGGSRKAGGPSSSILNTPPGSARKRRKPNDERGVVDAGGDMMVLSSPIRQRRGGEGGGRRVVAATPEAPKHGGRTTKRATVLDTPT